MSAAGVWLRLGLGTAVALTLLATVSPHRPGLRLPAAAQPAVGIAAGAVLSSIVGRRLPVLPARVPSPFTAIGRCVVLGLAALNEEIVWRRVLLGELFFKGAVAALAASTLAFAISHRARPGLHLGTGAAFGVVYLATGALTASVAAHWAYNVLVGARACDPARDSGRLQ